MKERRRGRRGEKQLSGHRRRQQWQSNRIALFVSKSALDLHSAQRQYRKIKRTHACDHPIYQEARTVLVLDFARKHTDIDIRINLLMYDSPHSDRVYFVDFDTAPAANQQKPISHQASNS